METVVVILAIAFVPVTLIVLAAIDSGRGYHKGYPYLPPAPPRHKPRRYL